MSQVLDREKDKLEKKRQRVILGKSDRGKYIVVEEEDKWGVFYKSKQSTKGENSTREKGVTLEETWGELKFNG